MLRIEAIGTSKQDKNNKKGKLFENLCKNLLDVLGYKITNPNIRYSGMEIDLEGERTLEKTPFICECKGHKESVASKDLNAFIGKLKLRQDKKKETFGIFLTLSNLNSEAKGAYNEYSGKDLMLLEEKNIIGFLFEHNIIKKQSEIIEIYKKAFPKFNIGDTELLYFNNNYFWVQYLISENNSVSDHISFLKGNGSLVSNNIVSEIIPLSEDFSSYILLQFNESVPIKHELTDEANYEEIVLVQGSSDYFEYQFPASPEFFVGRYNIIKEFDEEIKSIIKKKTSKRVIVINADSGWGKSSLILKLSNELKNDNFFSVPIDTRTASDVKFLLYALNFIINETTKSGFISIDIKQLMIGGYDSIDSILEKIHNILKNKYLFVFFDQFENIFYKHSLLEKFRNLALKLSDKQYNIIIGFAWKSDLIAQTEDFPYLMRDDIISVAKIFDLQRFGEIETLEIIKSLEKEIQLKLKKEIKFKLSEYSQGYPWLLKKLCAHIIKQNKNGVTQEALIEHFFNIQVLFNEDLKDLLPIEEEALRHIAKKAPVYASEIVNDYAQDAIQKLINKRLIVRIGPKYDIYWDIFRDFLNTGKIPSEESYILRTPPTSIIGILEHFLGKESIIFDDLKLEWSSEKSLYNLLKDARQLELLKIEDNMVKPCFDINKPHNEFIIDIKTIVKEKLSKHKIIKLLKESSLKNNPIPNEKICNILKESFPYIKADIKTWDTYAKIINNWIDFAYSDKFIYKNRKSDAHIPCMQFEPIKEFLISIKEGNSSNDVKKSRYKKSLSDAIALEFVELNKKNIKLTPSGIEFTTYPEKQKEIFKQSAMNIPIFKQFIKISNGTQNNRKMITEKLDTFVGNRWNKNTLSGIVKILINWAKNSGLWDFTAV